MKRGRAQPSLADQLMRHTQETGRSPLTKVDRGAGLALNEFLQDERLPPARSGPSSGPEANAGSATRLQGLEKPSAASGQLPRRKAHLGKGHFGFLPKVEKVQRRTHAAQDRRIVAPERTPAAQL